MKEERRPYVIYVGGSNSPEPRLSICNFVYSKRSLCVSCLRESWTEFLVLYLLDIGTLLLSFYNKFLVQAKELITEIELLKEEVANREQHILSLYRTFF